MEGGGWRGEGGKGRGAERQDGWRVAAKGQGAPGKADGHGGPGKARERQGEPGKAREGQGKPVTARTIF